MGQPKYIYFDDEILPQLSKEKNMSALINLLLKEHYTQRSLKEMSREEILLRIEQKKMEDEYKNKIKEIQCKNQQ